MATPYEAHHIKIKALHDHVIVSDMNFEEIKTRSGIILRSDDGKVQGIRPRWGQVYCIGPEQQDVKIGQWILVEHGRWTRGIKINDGEGEKIIRRVDTDCILAVSNEAPTFDDEYIADSI